ncbi:scavenger receptor cysteine-rich type 1 protein M130-like, partial [Chiloscyllium punctatum]|uniref:scavenger receptor cysteine-rich type 1 protein M130-like n=1 Tax=Chiloscyllium punctatum TaxID=137246 RepID=UPI003B63D41D
MGRVDSSGTGSVWNMFCPSDENIPELQKRLNKCTGNYYWKEGDDYCQDPEEIHLAEGAHRCSGRLEILFNGTWGTVCDDAWSESGARVVCEQLDCGPLLNTSGEEGDHPRGRPGTPIWLDEVQCRGSEPEVWACRSAYWGQHDCHHKEDVQVNCRYLPAKAPVLGYDPFRDDLIPIVASIILALLLITVTTALIYQISKRDRSILARNLAPYEDGIYEDIDSGLVKRLSKVSHVSEATNSSASLNKIEYYVDGDLQEEDGVLPEGYDDVDNGESQCQPRREGRGNTQSGHQGGGSHMG